MIEPLKIFIGYDHRQPIALHVLEQSIYENASVPVSITPLVLHTLPLERQGLTPFTFSRFLTPYLSQYKGWSLFLDADTLVNNDIKELFDLADPRFSVMVSKNEKQFEWASVMLFNNARCTKLTPEYVEQASGLHVLSWAPEEEIGELPSAWNHLVGYDKPREDAYLIHYTQGIPAFEETVMSEYVNHWQFYFNKRVIFAEPWLNLMGPSVHATDYKGHRVPKFLINEKTGKPFDQYKEQVEKVIRLRTSGAHKDGDVCGNQE
jgi:lipopolysaccharide biosynthesis glycosyltransferase